MFPSSSSTNEPPTDCQYSSNPLLSVAAATAIANCSKQNLYRASYCPPPTSYQYPTANQHVTTNQYPPTSPAVEANLEQIDRAILARYHPQSIKDPLLKRQVEAIAFKYAQKQQALDGANKYTTNQYQPHTYHAPLSNNQTQPPIGICGNNPDAKRRQQQQKKESKKQKMEPEEEIEGRVEKQQCRGGCGEMLGKNHFTKSQWKKQRKCLKCLLPHYIRLLGSVEKAIEYIAQEMGVPRSDLLLLEERMKLEEEERKKLHEKKQQEKKQQEKKQQEKKQQKKKQQEKKEEFVVEEKFKRQQLSVLDKHLETEKQNVKSFYSPKVTIDMKAANQTDRLAETYRLDFKSMSEECKEKVVVLERLASYYDYELHKNKEGFDEVVVQCLDCSIELRYMTWYLRLHGRYGDFPFVGKSTGDLLLNIVKGMTEKAKQKTCIVQHRRKKHLITPRSIEDTIQSSADLFKQLDVNGSKGDPVERAKKGLTELSDILCYDVVADYSQHDPFNQLLLDLE